jgi:hypothetical protein
MAYSVINQMLYSQQEGISPTPKTASKKSMHGMPAGAKMRK